MTPIKKAREEMTAAGASQEHAAFMERAGKILDVHARFKKALQSRKLTAGKAKWTAARQDRWPALASALALR